MLNKLPKLTNLDGLDISVLRQSNNKKVFKDEKKVKYTIYNDNQIYEGKNEEKD